MLRLRENGPWIYSEISKPGTIAERHEKVAVLFADIVEFTPWTATQEPQKVVATLDQIFSEFDRLCDRYGVEKIKTIGDAYMAAGGVPQGSQAKVQDVVRLALEMLEVVQQIPTSSAKSVQIRIGVHQGPVIAGVIGQHKFVYDLWGDTVNTAARMESHGIAGRLQRVHRGPRVRVGRDGGGAVRGGQLLGSGQRRMHTVCSRQLLLVGGRVRLRRLPRRQRLLDGLDGANAVQPWLVHQRRR